jgi:hypothetical protein
MRLKFRHLVVVMPLLLAACGTQTGDRAVSGAAIGAVPGALVAGPVGAVVGGVAGAAGGAFSDSEDVNLGEPVWR